MKRTFLAGLTLACAAALPSATASDAIDMLKPGGLEAFRPCSNWHRVAEVAAMADQKELTTKGEGAILVNGPSKDKSIPYLLTRETFGDVCIELEFMIPKGSNAGVYLMGRYEVQILDSFGKPKVGSADLGGIYARWDKTKPKGQQWWEGTRPKVNAAKEPGSWQTMTIVFHAPRFDAHGVKTKDATFKSVHVNGVLVQENASTSGPTASAPLQGDVMAGPIAIQGDHGPIAIRCFKVTPLPGPALTWQQELDAYWAKVAKAVSTGDFKSYQDTIHPDGVIIAGNKQASYPLAQALKRWRADFEKTASGKVKTHLEFRFKHRYGDPATAHESGIFCYTGQEPGQEAISTYIAFESLLTKKNGQWKMLMEHQKGAADQAAWEALQPIR